MKPSLITASVQLRYQEAPEAQIPVLQRCYKDTAVSKPYKIFGVTRHTFTMAVRRLKL